MLIGISNLAESSQQNFKRQTTHSQTTQKLLHSHKINTTSDLFTLYLQTLQNTTTVYKRIPFTKAARETRTFGLRRLEKI
jgi:hypothetical protein